MNYLTKENGLLSWLLTGDHKRIAILYLISISFFFFVGGSLAGLIRLELLTPQSDLMATDTYNKVFSMHASSWSFCFCAVGSCHDRKLFHSHDDRSEGSRIAQDQFAQLVSLHCGRYHDSLHMISGGVDTGWTFTTPLRRTM